MQVGPSQNESTSRRRSGLCKRGNWSRVIGRRRAFPNARSAVVVSLRSPRFHHDSTRLASWLHLAIPAAQRATNPSIGKEPRHTSYSVQRYRRSYVLEETTCGRRNGIRRALAAAQDCITTTSFEYCLIHLTQGDVRNMGQWKRGMLSLIACFPGRSVVIGVLSPMLEQCLSALLQAVA